MMKFLRSQSQTVLTVILAVIGLGFLFYGNSGSFLTTGGNAPTDFGRIDGEDLSVADLYNAVRNTRNNLVIEALEGHQENLSQTQIAEKAWRDLLLLHEANKLHIDVSDRELIAYIQGRPEFQKNGLYSPELYQTLMSELQNVRHISPDMYAGLKHDQLRIDAVSHVLFAAVHAPASNISAQYEKYFGPAEISYVTFRPTAVAGAIGADRIEAAYKADSMYPAYRTEEKRQVDYVLFPLTPEQAKLPEKEKKAAIQALGEKALDFALAFQPDPNATNAAPPVVDFQAEGKKRGLTPVTSNFFTVGTPPENFPPSPAFNNAAFALTKEDSISKVVELDNGVAVIHLDEIQPSELKPLAEVQPMIEKELAQKEAEQAQQFSAAIAAAVLREAVGKGSDFKTAAAAQHLTVETLPPLIPAKVLQNGQSDMRSQAIAGTVIGLAVGEVSKPVPVESDNTMLVLHVDGRTKADPAGWDSFEQRYSQYQDQQVRTWAFFDWTNWVCRQPGTHRPPNLAAYGAVE